jgi:glyoxylase-like metal-dependent hydrolase (beta-lactamase superfamily II)
MQFSALYAAALAAVFLAMAPPMARASEDIADQYPQSLLYAKPVEVIPHVWSAIGATAPPTYDNAGHNNNLSFIVTDAGVVVVNAGGSYGLARALHAEIAAITDRPVVLVINENGQGHAMLGNSYWAEQGVEILAHADAAEEFARTGDFDLQGAQRVQRERAENTAVVPPSRTFDDREVLELGGTRIEVLHLGPAHSPGDISVWLPDDRLVIAGDMAFHERMLPIFADTDTDAWIDTWETAFEPLGALYVVPGHGHPTNMAQVRRFTHDYLVDIREKMAAYLETGGDLAGAYYVDQAQWRHLDTFEELATRNAGRVFEEMEWE